MNTNHEQFPPRTELTEKLAEKEYRAAFVAAEIRRALPQQIRAIREARGWNQEQLGGEAGIPQANISRIENTRDTFLSFATLLKLAEAFDVALVVKFAPFSELEGWATRPLADAIPADFLSESKDREAWDEQTRAEAATGERATLDAYVRKTFGRHSTDPSEWTVFSEKTYTYGTMEQVASVGGSDGINRSSQGSQSPLRPGRVDEPKAKSA